MSSVQQLWCEPRWQPECKMLTGRASKTCKHWHMCNTRHLFHCHSPVALSALGARAQCSRDEAVSLATNLKPLAAWQLARTLQYYLTSGNVAFWSRSSTVKLCRDTPSLLRNERRRVGWSPNVRTSSTTNTDLQLANTDMWRAGLQIPPANKQESVRFESEWCVTQTVCQSMYR